MEVIGYTAGVYDLFHIGHLRLLKNAKGMCDRLVVGVTTDELAAYKGVTPVIPFEERIEIIRGIKYVDVAVAQNSMNKLEMCKKLKAQIMFVGDDWYGTEQWNTYEKELSAEGMKIIYFPYCKDTSSTKVRKVLDNILSEG